MDNETCERSRWEADERWDETTRAIKQTYIRHDCDQCAAARLVLLDRSVFYLRQRRGILFPRLLTYYRNSRRKRGNVVRIHLSAWMIYISTSGYINHGRSMVGGFLRSEIVTLDERKWRIMSVTELTGEVMNNGTIHGTIRIFAKCSFSPRRAREFFGQFNYLERNVANIRLKMYF